MLSLGTHDVHLWWTSLDRIEDPDLLDRYALLLSEEERQRRDRFVFESGRMQFLVSHALVRHVLSQYATVAPQDWVFASNTYGKPAIAEPSRHRDLHFNLSHTRGLALVAVARAEVGVDVENRGRCGELIEIADRFFAPAEVKQLQGAEPERIKSLFFEFWTLKEAYIKARGMGLALPLNGFSFDLSHTGQPAIAFHEGCADDPARWRFKQLHIVPDFQIAVAAPIGRETPWTVLLRETIPLGERNSCF